ncbi:MAG: hypothetical protein WKF70_08450 [Chitinophagaceae bacterium]
MKSFFLPGMLILLIACSDSTSNSSDQNNNTDNTSLTQPDAGDTTKQPGGMDNSSVISTDTAAMNYQNTVKKMDSINKAKNR